MSLNLCNSLKKCNGIERHPQQLSHAGVDLSLNVINRRKSSEIYLKPEDNRQKVEYLCVLVTFVDLKIVHACLHNIIVNRLNNPRCRRRWLYCHAQLHFIELLTVDYCDENYCYYH